MSTPRNIRNFCIIAHIDHGKSTLADRMLEITGTVEKRLMKAQYLDSLDLERERGITIKMAPVRMSYMLHDTRYTLNLIDTPGHSDFSYEVSRALHAVEGAILLVDATQGIQAQTLANFETAKRENLYVIGAVNKVDVANEDQVSDTIQDLANLLAASENSILKVSGKTGAGVLELLTAVIENVPPPRESQLGDDRALIFDSLYDEHKGVLAFVRVFDGALKTNDALYLLATETRLKAKEAGYLVPGFKRSDLISTGETGYIATGIKDPDKIRIGDTITTRHGVEPLPGYKEPQPVVFVSFYPDDASDYDDLYRALQKLRLTDASLVFEPDMSEALGRGFKGGFLGRLHFEIVAERLAQEFGIQTVHSFPSVAHVVTLRNGEKKTITNPKDFPEDYIAIQEPVAQLEIITPSEYLNSILRLREHFRFDNILTATIGHKTKITMSLPLADLVSDLDDKLKSASQGYASLSYEVLGYQSAELEKMEILVNNQAIPGLTRIIPRQNAEREGRRTVAKLKELLPKLQYKQALQAAIRGRIVAREDIAAMKKNVTGHLYGGDRTRKMKLWKKQQKGKERLKELGTKTQVRIPASIFKELLKK